MSSRRVTRSISAKTHQESTKPTTSEATSMKSCASSGSTACAQGTNSLQPTTFVPIATNNHTYLVAKVGPVWDDVSPKMLALGYTPPLRRNDTKVLTLKRQRLRVVNAIILKRTRELSAETGELAFLGTAAATLVFAQEEAGTAVCISPSGLLLTCAHCVAENEEDAVAAVRWLIFAHGQLVMARCLAWDSKRDLALLQIVEAEDFANNTRLAFGNFPYIQIAQIPPKVKSPLLCVGHRGSEDLEAAKPGVPTTYDVLEVSEGRFRGLDATQDPQDNSEIGALKHDCWTYWGHSGAPLVQRASGELVGVHSSWDSETGMRRGVPLEAIRVFIGEHTIVQPKFTEE